MCYILYVYALACSWRDNGMIICHRRRHAWLGLCEGQRVNRRPTRYFDPSQLFFLIRRYYIIVIIFMNTSKTPRH